MQKQYLDVKEIQNRIYELSKKYENKKILLYGAGVFFNEIYEKCDFSTMNIVGISDQKFLPDSQDLYLGYRKISPFDAKAFNYDVILTTVLKPNTVMAFLKEFVQKKDSVIENIVIQPEEKQETKQIKNKQNIFNLFFPKKHKPLQKLDPLQNNLKFLERIEKNYLFKRNFSNFNISMHEYRNLTANLDEESIITVSRIINRIKKITRNYDTEYIDIYTAEELAIQRKMIEDFYDLIQDFGNGIYAYKNYFLPISHFENSVFYFNHCMDDINLDFIKDKDIIDAGAYVGDSAIVLSKYTNKNVISFEANPSNFSLLKRTIGLNNLKNIVPVNLGLGDGLYTANIKDDLSCSHLTNEGSNLQKINITTLDKYVEENNIKCGLIKVDIEGAEPKFLKGAYNTIKEQRPTILLSIYHNASDFINLKPMIESWDLGYKFRIVNPSNGYVVTETTLICEREELCQLQ